MSNCARCGASFACGMVDTLASQPCWCMALPPLSAQALADLNAGASSALCFCPACLQAARAASAATPASPGAD